MLQREVGREAWKLDVLILSLWAVWLIWVTSLSLPSWMNATGVSWLILYAAWRWSWTKAAVIFLFVGWYLSTLSLMPSGLFWLSVMAMYLIVKLAQFRVMIKNAFQFSASVFLTSLSLSFIQLFLLTRIYPGEGLSWRLLGALVASSFAHAFIGFFIYTLFDRLTERT